MVCLKQSRKVRGLKADIEHYYQLGKKGADNALIMVGYMEAMEQVSEDLGSLSDITATTNEQYVTQLTQIKSEVDEGIKLLGKTGTTPSLENTNKEFTSALNDLSKLLGQTINYFEDNQVEKANALMPQFESLTKKMDNISMPDEEDIKNDIFTKKEQNEMLELVGKIKSQSSDLQKTIFTF